MTDQNDLKERMKEVFGYVLRHSNVLKKSEG